MRRFLTGVFWIAAPFVLGVVVFLFAVIATS